MSQRISEEAGNNEHIQNSEPDLAQLPELPPGVSIAAPGWWRRGPGRLQKRHPTIEDDVTIGVGTAILGPITIGRGSKIGAMALVLESVPPNSVVASKPAELLVKGGETLEKHQELTQGWDGKEPWEMDY